MSYPAPKQTVELQSIDANLPVAIRAAEFLQPAGPPPAATFFKVYVLRSRMEQPFEVSHRFLQSIIQCHFGLPAQLVSSQRDVWLALLGVVGRQWVEGEFRLAPYQLQDFFGQLKHGELARIPMLIGPTKLAGLCIMRTKPSIRSST